MTYEPLVGFEDDYEICDTYPHHIRRIGANDDISFRTRDKDGYVQVKLNRRPYLLHRLIAQQFIDNDDTEHKKQVDHINHIRDDNHIENLRWCTPSTNQRNKISTHGVQYTYVPYEEVPDDTIAITRYGNHQLDHIIYSFSTDTFYFDTDEAYRVLSVQYLNGYPYVRVRDVNNKLIKIMINHFKKMNGM